VVVGRILHFAELADVAEPAGSEEMQGGLQPKPRVNGTKERMSKVSHFS
jgi:hypothetical protein